MIDVNGSITMKHPRTKMELKLLRLPSAKVLRVGIAFPGNRQGVESALRALPGAVLEQLGVDHWR